MKASELAATLGGTLEGADVELSACGGLEEARPGDLSFCKDPRALRKNCGLRELGIQKHSGCYPR